MMYEIYKWVHYIAQGFLIGIICALYFVPLKRSRYSEKQQKRRGMVLHGVFSLVLLVTGFGMLARLKIHSFPLWVNLKIFIWIFLSVLLPLLIAWANRKVFIGRGKKWKLVGFLFVLALLIVSIMLAYFLAKTKPSSWSSIADFFTLFF